MQGLRKATVTRAERDEPGAASLARFEALFLEHADVVRAYALRRSDPDTAQEVVSETFTIAWRRLGDLPDPPLPWLLGVARRTMANSRRSSHRQQALALRLVGTGRDTSLDPTGEVDTRLSALAALELLSPAEREAIELLAWEGLSSAEAAEVLGCSRAVFAVRVHRARRRLRPHLSSSLIEEPRSGTPASTSGKTPENAKEAR